ACAGNRQWSVARPDTKLIETQPARFNNLPPDPRSPGIMWKRTLTACVLALSVLLVPAPRAADPRPDEPINLTCNTADNEDDPHPSSDGRTLLYSCDAKGKIDIMVARRKTVSDVW